MMRNSVVSGSSRVSHLADNVVLLQYRSLDHSISRALTVLKTRASHHAPEAREFQITTDGITIT